VTAGTTYTVTVGAGAPAVNENSAPYDGSNGFNSEFSTIISTGGGGGGTTNVGSNGGSGGGGGRVGTFFNWRLRRHAPYKPITRK
jgi:hypothetical protein